MSWQAALRNLSNPVPFDPKTTKPGDIVAFPSSSGSGHSTIYLGNGLVVSAKGTGVEVGTVKHEKREHGDQAVTRKYAGKR